MSDRQQRVDHWKNYLVNEGVAPTIADVWSAQIRNAIKLAPRAFGRSSKNVGATRLGGSPDLPADTTWPTRPAYSGRALELLIGEHLHVPRPLTFLAQLNLADVVDLDLGYTLPYSAGLLLFFYDIESEPWGSEPTEAIGARVLYISDTSQLQQRLSVARPPIREQAIKVQKVDQLPGLEWMRDQSIGRLVENFDELETAIPFVVHGNETLFSMLYGHHFGGWPFPVQGPVEDDCERRFLRAQGVPEETLRNPVPSADFEESKREWRLLFQLELSELCLDNPSDGALYFMCRQTDIEAGRFSEAVAIVQAT